MKNITLIILALFSLLLKAEDIDFLKLNAEQKETSPSVRYASSLHPIAILLSTFSSKRNAIGSFN